MRRSEPGSTAVVGWLAVVVLSTAIGWLGRELTGPFESPRPIEDEVDARFAGEPELAGFPYGSEAWAAEWARRAREGDVESVASGWNWPLVTVTTPDPSLGIPERIRIRLDFEDGYCHRGVVDPKAESAEEAFVLVADPLGWRRLLDREFGIFVALVRGDIRLTKGSMTTLVRYTGAANAILEHAREIDTVYPKELAVHPPRSEEN